MSEINGAKTFIIYKKINELLEELGKTLPEDDLSIQKALLDIHISLAGFCKSMIIHYGK